MAGETIPVLGVGFTLVLNVERGDRGHRVAKLLHVSRRSSITGVALTHWYEIGRWEFTSERHLTEQITDMGAAFSKACIAGLWTQDPLPLLGGPPDGPQ